MGEPTRKSKYTEIVKGRRNGNEKPWVFVTLLKGTRAISFEELYYILRWIGELEDEKYPEYYHQGRQMVIDFLTDAINGIPYSELNRKYRFLNPPIMIDPRQQTMELNSLP